MPADPDRIAALLADPSGPPAIVRGAGRAYGDAALCSHGLVLRMPIGGEIAVDPRALTLRAEAGVTIEAANRAAVAHGLFLPVLPGTGAATLGGAVAADVHGKNHHRAGSLGEHVRSLELVPADGPPCTLVAASSDPATQRLLALTLGGMGLTGWIRSVELSLHPVPSAWIRTADRPTGSLAETVDLLRSFEGRFPHAVAWLDALATGDRLGRGIVSGGEPAEAGELPSAWRARPYEIPARPVVPFPPGGDGVVHRTGVRVFNTVRHLAGRLRSGERCVPWDRFFFPLDALSGWNRLYGARGFRQHQCLLPFDEAGDGVRGILARLIAADHPPYLAVLKGFGPGRGGLSFPRPGLTLAVDLPRRPGLDEVLDEVDREVADRGGRIYLAKDAGMRTEIFERTTPEAVAFRGALAQLDPTGRFDSDLAERLGLRGDGRPVVRR